MSMVIGYHLKLSGPINFSIRNMLLSILFWRFGYQFFNTSILTDSIPNINVWSDKRNVRVCDYNLRHFQRQSRYSKLTFNGPGNFFRSFLHILLFCNIQIVVGYPHKEFPDFQLHILRFVAFQIVILAVDPEKRK